MYVHTEFVDTYYLVWLWFVGHVTTVLSVPPTAGKTVTEEDVEEMLESDNVGIFTQDVSRF